MSSSPKAFLRMPLGYGPFPGPRQSILAVPHTGWDKVRNTTSTVVFKTDAAYLSSLLPHPCFQIDPAFLDSGGLVTASVSNTRVENLPWLAGRGYNHCGLYIHGVICRGKSEVLRGKYLSVFFEDRPDPIISGREELGFAKVFSTIEVKEESDEGSNKVNYTLRLGWEDSIFGEVVLQDLVNEHLSSHVKQEPSTTEGLLHYKYIPRTGCPGIADVEYPTFSPLPSTSNAPRVFRSAKASGATLSFRSLGFEELPTLCHIAEKLSGIKMREIVSANLVLSEGATDLSNQRAIDL